MNLNRQADLLLRDIPQILLAGKSCEQALRGMLSGCLEDYAVSLRLSREMMRLNYRAELLPLVEKLCQRFPRSIDFHHIRAQLDPAHADAFARLTRDTGRKRNLAAKLLSEQGRDADALALLQSGSVEPGFVLMDGLAEHALLREMGTPDPTILPRLKQTHGDDPRLAQYYLSLAFSEDGPSALVAAFEADPVPQYPIRSQVFGWLLAANDFNTAQDFYQKWLEGQGKPGLERDDACRLILASSKPEIAQDWYGPQIADMDDVRKSHAVHVLSARTALAARDHVSAEKRAEIGVRLFPASTALFRLLIEALFRQGHWEDVNGRLDARLSAFPHDRGLDPLRSEMATRQGLPTMGAVGLKAVELALSQGDLEAADVILEATATPDFLTRMRAKELRMSLAAQTGDLSAASAIANMLETLHPTRPGTWVATGRIHFLSGDMEAAKRARSRFFELRLGRVNGVELSARRDVPDLVLEATEPTQHFTSAPDIRAQIDASLEQAPATPGAWMQFLYRAVHAELLTPSDPSGDRHIPTKLMTYWEGETSKPLEAILCEWTMRLPGWFHARFDAGSARFWLSEKAPDLVAAFDASDNPASRSDIFRAAYLRQEGGLYVDLDERPRRDVLDWFNGADIVLTHEPGHSTIANNFIATTPGHPILDGVCTAMSNLDQPAQGVETWMATGPGLFAQEVGRWIWEGLRNERPLSGLHLLRHNAYQARVATNLQLPHKYTSDYWRKL